MLRRVSPSSPDSGERRTQGSTTLDDQVDLNITVYNSDIALVRDVRTLELPRGTFDLSFMDIAATVNPATVHFRSLSEPSRVSVLEQNYEYDLLEPEKLLRKYVGRDVTLVRTRQVDGTTREEEVTAHLLSYNNQPVWRIDGEIVTGLHADHIRFPELPDTLFTRPTLIWSLDNGGATRHRVEAAYLAGKLSWNADYVLTVGARRQSGRHRRVGDVDQRQRHGVSERQAPARGRRSQSRAAEPQQDADGRSDGRAGGAGRGADGTGGVLRLSPVHARPQDDHQQQRDEAGEHALRHPLSRPEALRRQRQPVLLSQRSPGRARPSRIPSKCSINSRTKRKAASACRCRPARCASISRIRTAACISSAKIESRIRRRTKC